MIAEYFIYKLLSTALMVGIFLYWRRKMKRNSDSTYVAPKETTDGKFAVEKQPDDDIDEIVYEEIRVNPDFKNDDYSQLNINTNGNNNDLGDSSSGRGRSGSLVG